MNDTWKFHAPAARLYHLVHRDDAPKWNAVRTPDGIGTLMKAHSYPKGCQVVLAREKERTKQKPHDQVMREYDAQEIKPA